VQDGFRLGHALADCPDVLLHRSYRR
jgi:hypothetical protein